MKPLTIFILMLISAQVTAQVSRSQEVQQTIDRFFERFHQRDTSGIRQLLTADAKLQSIGADPQGRPVLHTEAIHRFLSSLAAMPDSLAFEEKLLDYQVKVDGNMAHAWTPYTFHLDGAFHHCGVNSFQLFHDGNAWRIFHIADTRRRQECEE